MSAVQYIHQDSTMTDPSGAIEVDFLLPTGILITLPCRGGQTVIDIKERLWTEAKRYPLYSSLREHGWYVLVFVNRKAEQEECFDEQLRLCDLQMYKPLFKIVERKGNEAEKKLSTQISWLIGRQIKEFENSRDAEVTDFRIAMVSECRQAIEARAQFTWYDQLMYCYPPVLEVGPAINLLIQEKLNENGCYRVSVDFSNLGKMGQSTTILVRDLETPLSVIEKSLKKIHQTDGEPEISQNPHDYVLKVSSVGGKQCMIEPLINLQIAHLSIELFCGI
jgi:phosphatidylinositol-4,5-bisphosphate 3-kinase